MATEDFRRIVESLRTAVAIGDPRGVVAFANPAFVQMAGRGLQEIVGAPLTALFAEGDRKRVQQNVARIAEGKTASALLEARLAGGGLSERWVQLAMQPALDARDQAAGVVISLQDIESQRETEAALNLSAARLLALAEASPAAALIENSAGEIELVNEAFCRLLGLESAPQSLMGLAVGEALARSQGVDRAVVAKALAASEKSALVPVRLAGGRASALERQPIVVEGRPRGALWSAREEPAAGGGEAERSTSEIALIEKIGQELSVALEGMAAISIRAQQMEFDPALVEHFQRIRESTESAMGAIGDLVDFSKVSGGVVLHKADFGLRAALAELVKRVSANAEERGCRLRMKVEQDVADRLEGDVERLQLVLKNLLDNAFALLPGAEISLHIQPEYLTESGIQLSFSVSAAPVGGRVLPRVSAEAGMGVAVAKFMVTAMGGRLAVGARAGAEALYAFTIEFPVRPAPAPPRRPVHVSLVGLPVLVVSEDSEQRLALSNLLRGWRMVPLEADNAAMAIALLERLEQEASPVALVIVSNRLPVQDGFLLAFRIRHHPRLASTIVMMLATEGRPGDAIACRENGIAAYMRYPINDRQLNEAIVAVTGASVDADETPTLVTRHSLREQRKGATVLLVDAHRDTQILAAHILAKRDCSVVSAQDRAEALAALEQDLYDLVLVDTSLPGLDGEDTAALLRAAIARDGDKAEIHAISLEHSPAFRAQKTAAGFSGTLAKPLRKDDLLGLLGSLGKLPPEDD